MKASATSERNAVIPPSGGEPPVAARTDSSPAGGGKSGTDKNGCAVPQGVKAAAATPDVTGAAISNAESPPPAAAKTQPAPARTSGPETLPAQSTNVPGTTVAEEPAAPPEAPEAKPPDPKVQAVKLQETPSDQDAAVPSARPAEAKPQDAKTQDVKTADAKVVETKVGESRPMNGTQGMRPILAVRAIAKEENFVEGDYVVYPTHGVGKVEKIAVEDIAGHRLELIHITFEENRMTLRVPVAKARTAGLRKLATQAKFDEALAVLRGRARIKRTMWSRRAQEYEAKINSGDPIAIAEVVRDLHRNAGQPDQSFSERQIYESAMDRLAAELAALDATDKLTAAAKLVNFLKAA